MSRGQFYLDKSNAKLAGVCAGIADYTGLDAFWIRLGTVALTLLGFSLTIPIYIAIAILADKRPMALYSEEEEDRLLRRMERRRARRGSLDRYGLHMPGTSRSSRLRQDMSDLDKRIADMEAHYSASSNSRLAAEIDSLR